MRITPIENLLINDGFDVGFDSPVFLFSLGCLVACNGLIGAIAYRFEARAADSVSLHKDLLNGICTSLGQLDVI